MLVKTHYRQRPVPAVAEQTGVDELTVAPSTSPSAPLPQDRPPSSTRATSSSAAAPLHGLCSVLRKDACGKSSRKGDWRGCQTLFWLRLAVLGCRTPVLELTESFGPKEWSKKRRGARWRPVHLGG